MEKSINLAEMASTADYSAMNYGQLLETKIAMLWAILKTNSLLKTKRVEEMEKLTHDYVEAMNRYCSTKTETFDLLEKEEFWSDPTISFESNDVDEQNAVVNAIEMENNQDKGENSPVLPDPPVFSQGNIDVNEPMEPLVDVIPAIVESKEEDALEEEDYHPMAPLEDKEKTFVEKAVEFARTLPVPVGVRVEHPYWVEHYFRVSDDGCFSVNMDDISNIKGKNASLDDIEKFKEYTEKYIKSYYNGKYYTIFNDDYMLMEKGNMIVVRLYCTNMANSDTSMQGKESSGSTKKRKSKALKLTENALKYATEDVKNHAVPKNIDTNAPYFVDYYFNYDAIKERRWITKFLSCEGGRNMDADGLEELKAFGAEYSKLYFGETAVFTTEDCLACVTKNCTIMVRVYVNPAKEGYDNASIKPVTIVEGIEVPIVYPEIVEAVKMAKEKPAPAGIDVDEPYYMQCNYDITSIGELVENGLPFASNVSADELENHRKYHKRFAETKSSIIESADDYTAFMWDENKRVSVFRYITKEKAAEA